MDKQVILAKDADDIFCLYPLVKKLVEKMNSPEITTRSLMEFLLSGYVWVFAAIKDKRVIGFITAYIARPPYDATAVFPFIYMDEKDPELVDQLFEAVSAFAKASGVKYFMYHSQSEKLGDYFKALLESQGLTTTRTEYIHFGMRRE